MTDTASIIRVMIIALMASSTCVASTAQAATPLAAPCPATDCINLPVDAGVLNVKDFGAYGDGIHDDTAAINAALAASGGDTGISFWQNRTVYLPLGTYLVSAPLLKRYSDGSFASGFVLLGQSRQGTIIKLKDSAPGYQDASKPRAVLFTTSKLLDPSKITAGGRDFIGQGEGNDAYGNSVENLTIHVGANNLGAIGIDYLSSRLGAIRRVTVLAPTTSGVTGISMQRKWPGPALVQDVSVQGFDKGIAVDQTSYGVTLERVTLTAQRNIGLYNNHNMLAVRVLRTRDVPRPILNAASDGLIVLHGADLATTLANAGEAIVNRGSMNIRNLGMRGYSLLMGAAPQSFISGAYVLEGIYNGNIKTANSYQNWSITANDPPLPVNTPVTKWVSVKQYGAIPNSGVSATNAIRQAFASGADTIYFPFGTYLVDDNIVVPATVKRIVGMGSTISPHSVRQTSFSFSLGLLRPMNTSSPLIIEDLALDGADQQDQLLLEASGTQPLVLRDVVVMSNQALWRPTTGGRVFGENLVSGPMLVEGPQPVWLRQLDSEGGGVRLTNRSSQLWVFGFKTQGALISVDNSNGARTELLGGMLTADSTLNPGMPAFRNTDSNLLLSYAEEAPASDLALTVHMQNITKTLTKNVLASSLMQRNLGRLVPQLVSTALPSTAVVVKPPVDPVPTPVPTPVAQGPLFGDAFGINIKSEKITKPEMDMIAALGIKRVRTSITWYAVEQQKGKYYWNFDLPRQSDADDYAVKPWFDYDSFLAALKERKLHPDVTLHEGSFVYGKLINMAPVGSSPEYRLSAPRTDTELAAFAAFAAATVQHYKGIYGTDAFTWHIWNEPDTDGGFAPKTDAGIVGKMVSMACDAIKKVDPQARVMGPALGAYGDGDLRYNFIDGMFTLSNPLNCIDGLTVHPYRSAVPETAPIDYATVMQHLAKWQPANRPLVRVAVDEWGYANDKHITVPSTQLWRNFSGEEQAALMLRMYLTNLSNNVPLTVIYDWRDNGTDPYNWEHHFGVIGYNKEEKPAYKMFKTVWPLLSGRALQLVDFKPTNCTTHEHALRFGTNATDSSAWTVVWTDDTASRSLLLNGAVTKIMDIFGNPVAPKVLNGGNGVTITGSPLLLQHALGTPPALACTTALAAVP